MGFHLQSVRIGSQAVIFAPLKMSKLSLILINQSENIYEVPVSTIVVQGSHYLDMM